MSLASTRAGIQRERHRVDSEVAAAQVFADGRLMDFRSTSRLIVFLGARHHDLGAHVPGQQHAHGFQIFVHPLDDGACLLQVLDHAQRVSLDGKIQVADVVSRDHVADAAADEIHVHLVSARRVRDQGHALVLLGREPRFHHV
jgi:hypothetical protein